MWASFQYISPAVITDISFLSQWLQIFSARNEWVRIYHQLCRISDPIHSEVVLFLLIEGFKFYLPKDKEIVWQMNSIATPALVGGDPSRPQLPLIIELAK